MPRGVRTERISAKDVEVLGFVARFGLVPRQAVSAWAGSGRAATLRRERRLRLAGLLVSHPRVGLHGPFAIATRSGLRLSGHPELRPARLSYGELAHQVALTLLAARLERAGERLLSEREMLAQERALDLRVHSARLGQGRFHRADLLRLRPDEEPPEAIELELTPKGARRLDRILRGWRRAVGEGKVSGVTYHCAPAALRAVKRAVARTRASEVVTIRPLEPGLLAARRPPATAAPEAPASGPRPASPRVV